MQLADSLHLQDPAARSWWEVVTCYPGLHAIYMHKLAHWFWNHRLRWLGRFTSHVGRWLTGIEIHPGAKIGSCVFESSEASLEEFESEVVGLVEAGCAMNLTIA